MGEIISRSKFTLFLNKKMYTSQSSSLKITADRVPYFENVDHILVTDNLPKIDQVKLEILEALT